MVTGLLARCIVVTIGTLYPAYRSYKALIKSDLREVVNCLRYWTVFAIFSACETITDVFLSWFPFYYWIKIGIILWIVSPTGSTILYKRFIQPLLKEREHEIDQLIEHTRQRSYTAILDLTSQGVRYASNLFLNTAVLGQGYLSEHMKRSFSMSDINTTSLKTPLNQPSTVHEESEPETVSDSARRLKEGQKNLSKGSHRKPLSHHQEKPDDSSDNPIDEYEMSKVMTRQTRNATHGNSSKRPVKGTKSTKKSSAYDQQEAVSSNDTDEEVENFRRRN